MTKQKVNLFLHAFIQFLGQGFVATIVPMHYKPLLGMVIGIAGAIAAYFDTTMASK